MNTQLIQSGGFQQLSKIQYVYLDFDGEQTSYNGELLTINDVMFEGSKFTQAQINDAGVIFVTERPVEFESLSIQSGYATVFNFSGNVVGLTDNNRVHLSLLNDEVIAPIATSVASNAISVVSSTHDDSVDCAFPRDLDPDGIQTAVTTLTSIGENAIPIRSAYEERLSYSSLLQVSVDIGTYSAPMTIVNKEKSASVTGAGFSYTTTSNSIVIYTDTNKWVDANKTTADTDDDLLCWAATASNMLYWAGWTNSLSISNWTIDSSDDLFDYFEYCFSDNGSYTYYGLKWFFTGVYDGQNESGIAKETNKGGGFYTNLAFTNYAAYNYGYDSLNYYSVITSLTDWLEDGDICGLSIYKNWSDTTVYNGHAITCWGFTYDSSKTSGDKDYYTGIYVTDSDDSVTQLQYYSIAWNSSVNGYVMVDYCGAEWLIGGVAMLKVNTGHTSTFTANVYGTVCSETIPDDGIQNVYNGGIAKEIDIDSGGSQVVFNGGIASHTTINSGGRRLRL